jgi:hypothetical protein
MNAFEQYLQAHQIEALMVSVAAGVRYLTVWKVLKGKPITVNQAHKIRAGMYSMTGVPYHGPLVTLPAPAVDQLPTLPIKNIKRHNNESSGMAE